jgi:CheY-like chemotaxis protein
MAPPPELAGLHVLVVDDEEDTREYLRALLERCKATVTLAVNTTEALALTAKLRPDVLLSDIAMPVEDGYVLIQKLRAQPEAAGGRTPAIALTAHARSEDRTRAMLAGFHNHVTKPIDPEELMAVLTAVVGRSRRRL